MKTDEPIITVDDSTLVEKLIASSSGFGFACAAFILASLVFVPITMRLAGRVGIPIWLNAALVMLELIGLTATAGIAGAIIAERRFTARRSP